MVCLCVLQTSHRPGSLLAQPASVTQVTTLPNLQRLSLHARPVMAGSSPPGQMSILQGSSPPAHAALMNRANSLTGMSSAFAGGSPRISMAQAQHQPQMTSLALGHMGAGLDGSVSVPTPLPSNVLLPASAIPGAAMGGGGIHHHHPLPGSGPAVAHTHMQTASNGWAAALPATAPHTIYIPISQPQLNVVGEHIHTVAAISGAQLNITVVPNGQLELVISGSAAQVQSAQALLNTVIQNKVVITGM